VSCSVTLTGPLGKSLCTHDHESVGNNPFHQGATQVEVICPYLYGFYMVNGTWMLADFQTPMSKVSGGLPPVWFFFWLAILQEDFYSTHTDMSICI